MNDTALDPIVAAIHAGDPAGAERLCRSRLQLHPREAAVWNLLGSSLQLQGRLAEAVEVYAQLIRVRPGDAMLWSRYAGALQRADDLAAAQQAAANAVRLAPGNADMLEQLGLLQLQLHEPWLARDTLLQAHDKLPDSPGICIHAAAACAACRDPGVEALLRPWRSWLPLDERLQFELISLQSQLGEAEIALELLEDLVARVPSHRVARLMLANACERVNRLEQAETILQGLIAEPGVDDQMRHEIEKQQARLALRKGAFAEARVLLEYAGPRNGADFAHWFVLAEACDKSGDAHAAMRALEQAHAQQLGELTATAPHLLEPEEGIFSRAAARVTARDYHAWPTLDAPRVAQSPVFVVGFPRSGTSLLEQMLDAHPRLQSMDERPFFDMLARQLEEAGIRLPQEMHKLGQDDCDGLRQRYLGLVCAKIQRRPGSRLIDKNPLNMLRLPLIHRMFPQAKFILALRHPCDVVLSCYMQNFRGDMLAAATRSIELAARAYVAVMESWIHHVELFKPDVLVLRHEDLVADPAVHVGRIAAFLGLEDADSMLGFATHARAKGYIKTPSYAQVVEPINAKGVGRWLRYREWLDPTVPILKPMLDCWQYATDSASPRRQLGADTGSWQA